MLSSSTNQQRYHCLAKPAFTTNTAQNSAVGLKLPELKFSGWNTQRKKLLLAMRQRTRNGADPAGGTRLSHLSEYKDTISSHGHGYRIRCSTCYASICHVAQRRMQDLDSTASRGQRADNLSCWGDVVSCRSWDNHARDAVSHGRHHDR